jgi:hypothetical protein
MITDYSGTGSKTFIYNYAIEQIEPNEPISAIEQIEPMDSIEPSSLLFSFA